MVETTGETGAEFWRMVGRSNEAVRGASNILSLRLFKRLKRLKAKHQLKLNQLICECGLPVNIIYFLVHPPPPHTPFTNLYILSRECCNISRTLAGNETQKTTSEPNTKFHQRKRGYCTIAKCNHSNSSFTALKPSHSSTISSLGTTRGSKPNHKTYFNFVNISTTKKLILLFNVNCGCDLNYL